MNKKDFALLKNAKSSVKHFMGKKIVHPLAELRTVSVVQTASVKSRLGDDFMDNGTF